MKKSFLVILLFIFSISLVSAQKLKKVFNGKNLSGWVVPNPNYENWTVSNGILHVKSSDDRKGSILWTEKEYEDFIVEAEYKNIDGIVDSGIFLRSEKDQIQIGISGSLKRDLTGSPYIPGKSYPVEAKIDNVLNKDDWNTLKVKVQGKSYTVWLNGKEVMNYTSEDMVEKGPIGIQLHPGNNMSIDYRTIKVAEL